MKQVVEKYLDLVLGDHESENEKLRALRLVLNELETAVLQLPAPKFPDIESDPPYRYKEFYSRIVKSFPNFGFYPIVDPLEPIEQMPVMGDAIDDAADIANDLAKAIWRWENTNAEDALWNLVNDYEIHWGRHLNDLRWYLYQPFSR